MSLFGGDSAPTSDVPGPSSPGFPSEASDFSIEEIDAIGDVASQRAVSTDYEGSEAGIHARGPSQEVDDDDQVDHPETETEGEEQVGGLNRKWARAWRHYTNEERTLAGSLDQLRANDLAAHLYNAHALNLRVRDDPSMIKHSDRARRGKINWIPKDIITGERPWYPDVDWTAWPLESHHVPRPDQIFGTSPPRKGVAKVGTGLREELHAVFLRQAKAMWDQRQSTEQYKQSDQDASGPPDEEHVPSGPASRSRSRSMSVSGSRSRPASNSPLPGEDPPSPSLQMPSSPPILPDTATDVKHEDGHAKSNIESDATARPVFSADDDHSRRLVAPTVQHIMASLDNLLMSLHHQREGQYLRSKDAGNTSDSSTQSRSKSASTSRSRSKSAMSRPDKKMRASTPAPTALSPENDSDASSDGARKAVVSPSSSYRKGTHRAGPRDWSEVLGIAALAGWNPVIVQRAAKRCSALFSETMTFRALPEHGPVVDIASSDLSDSATDDDTPASGYFCPFPMCVHHLSPYERAWRWREHLKRNHKQSSSQIQTLEEEAERRMARGQATITGRIRRYNILDFNPRNWAPSEPLKCPHCHNSPVYSQLKRLLDHLKRTHKYDPRIQEPPSTVETAESDDDASAADTDDVEEDAVDSADEMVGGVHVDGFLQPCVKRAGRGKDRDVRLKKQGGKRSKAERKSAKRKRVLLEEEDERLA